MVEGWFNAFREFGGPTWYGDHRTPVVIDFTITQIAVIFSVFLTTFLIIFPGVRRRKWASFLSTVHTLLIGAAILIAHFHPSWHQADVELFAPYRSFSSERVLGMLGIRIGLSCANITLQGSTEKNTHEFMNYNERIYFTDVKTMHQNLLDSLRKGLPYPIITVIEYLAVEKAGFTWGRGYRLAGYYTDFLLWISFSLWCLLVLMICALPRYFSRMLASTGCCLCTANAVYAVSCPKSLSIPFPTSSEQHARIVFYFGWCFWLILATGISCVLAGLSIRVFELNCSCKFKTFLQPDSEATSNSTRTSGQSSSSPSTSCSVVLTKFNRLPSKHFKGKFSTIFQLKGQIIEPDGIHNSPPILRITADDLGFPPSSLLAEEISEPDSVKLQMEDDGLQRRYKEKQLLYRF